MPQMKPMNWLWLLIYFIMNLFLIIMSMYYFKFNKMSFINKMYKMNKNMKIKW